MTGQRRGKFLIPSAWRRNGCEPRLRQALALSGTIGIGRGLTPPRA